MATQRQNQILDLYRQLGSKQAVANELGISRSTVRSALNKFGDLEQAWPTPDGMQTDRSCVHIQHGPGGSEVVQEWRRISKEKQGLVDLAKSLANDVPRFKQPKPRKIIQSDLCGLIAMGDLHVGKLCYARETGEGYDTDTAHALGCAAVAECSEYTRQAETVIFLVNGDHWHADNRNGETEKSRNRLDMDSRYIRNLRVGCDVIRSGVKEILKRGSRVHLIITPGNHDWHTAAAASLIMSAYYSESDRVSVDDSDAVRKCVLFGQNMIGAAHGDGIKPDGWAKVLPADPVFKPHWSGTRHHYLFLGHIHRRRQIAPVQIDETAGLHVEYLNALCSADAWHYESGYVGSGRCIDAMIFDREDGMTGRITRNARQLMRRAGIDPESMRVESQAVSL